jgi:hypothetical protein
MAHRFGSAKPQVVTDMQDQIVIQQEEVKIEELACSVQTSISINPSPINIRSKQPRGRN